MTRKNKKLEVKQLDITDCGAACLTSVFAYYKYFKPISGIRLEAGTDKNGTSLLGMSNAAKSNGFDALPVKVTDKSLHTTDLPAIAHLNIEDKWHHFVVIYDIHDDGYTIMDPAIGKMKKINKPSFDRSWTGILLIITPGIRFKETNEVISVESRIFKIIKQHKNSLFKAFAGAIIYSLLGIASAFYIEILTDKIIPQSSFKNLHLYSLALGMIIIMRVLTGISKSLILIKTGTRIDSHLINDYNEHLLRLRSSFFNSMKTGEILTRINDAIKIRNFINSTVQEILVNSLIVIITFSMMVYYSPILSLILFLSIPLYLFILRFLNSSNSKYLRRTMEFGAEMESQLLETIEGVQTIKSFVKESFFIQKLRKTTKDLLSSILRTSRDFTLAFHLSDLISSLWLLVIFWVGAKEVIMARMSYGELFSYYSLYSYLSSPLIKLILSNRGIQDAKIATDRLFQVMDLEREPTMANKSSILNIHQITLHTQNLSFNYPGRTELLKNISFRCDPGTITALAGESGSGKSTVLSLLLKFHSPGNGKIMINEHYLDELSPEILRQQISYVPQAVKLFSGSLGYNISFESNNWDELRMKRCLEITGLSSFVSNLPGGIRSYISEDGNNFSGGEKQKIAMARAVYKDSPLFILDEPGSALDIQSEINLIELLNQLRNKGKTIIIAAHKLSFIRSSDQILILKNGVISESGNHKRLLQLKGNYYSLWKNQQTELNYA